MKMIGHQRVIQNLDPTERGITSYHRNKFLGVLALQAGSPKGEEPGNDSGDDVVKSLTLS
jgi:hypothetical protein